MVTVKKIDGSSLVEVIVAMVIIGICFSMFIALTGKIYGNNEDHKIIKAVILYDSLWQSTIVADKLEEVEGFNEEFSYEVFIEPVDQKPNLYLVNVNIHTKRKKLFFERKQYLYRPYEED